MNLASVKQLVRRGVGYAAPEGTWRRRCVRRTKHTLKRWFGKRVPLVDRPLDVYDPVALDEVLVACGREPLAGSATDPAAGPAGAMRFVLCLLQRRPDLRQRFPRALSGGPDGPFCAWLCGSGAGELGLSPAAVGHLRAAFAGRPGDRVRQVYEHREDVRKTYLLGLTPAGRRRFACWLLESPEAEGEGGRERVLWFLFECAEDPSQGLALTYLLCPAWQKQAPDGLTAYGWRRLVDWVCRRYRIEADWPHQAARPDFLSPAEELRLLYRARRDLRALAPGAFRDDAATRRLVEAVRREHPAVEVPPDGLHTPGVNVLAHFCYPSGLQEAARSTVRALGRAGVRVSCRDVPANPKDDPCREGYRGLEVYDATLLHLAPEPLVDLCYPLSGLAQSRGIHRIAVWYWELEAVPKEWVRHARLIQEIWAPTRFIADAMRRVMPVPVVHMLPGAELKPFAPLPRSHFGLPDDRCLFLFVFDMNSIMERKNPLGLIRAFRKAFGRNDGAQLVIKVTRGDATPENFKLLSEAAREAGAVLINQVMTREESYALMNTCDCYVSLHRSEGFGFTLAEAMLMGKPAIGTAYSGNMDFMTPENSRLVGFNKVPITQDLPFYRKGCLWADPDLDEAAHWMRWVYEHPRDAKALGERARHDVGQVLSLDAAGRRMARRLQEITAAGRLGRAA